MKYENICWPMDTVELWGHSTAAGRIKCFLFVRIDHLLTAQDVTFDDIEEGCLFITYFVTTTRYKQEETDVNNSVMDTFAVIDSLRSKVTTNNGNVRKPKLMEIPMPVTMTITLDIPNLFVFSSGISKYGFIAMLYNL